MIFDTGFAHSMPARQLSAVLQGVKQLVPTKGLGRADENAPPFLPRALHRQTRERASKPVPTVTTRSLRRRADCLDGLGLDLAMEAAYVGAFRLSIPWNSLRSHLSSSLSGFAD
jgi:hypothetical protein